MASRDGRWLETQKPSFACGRRRTVRRFGCRQASVG
jgi:hypothetical protein